MKKVLTVFIFSISLLSFADGPKDSKALEGQYELIEASSEYAKSYHCSKEIEVSVSEDAVVLTGVSDNNSYASFWAENEGCNNTEGDIGPLRTKCTRFNKKSVSYSDTSYLTIVGFVREFERIDLKGKNDNKLIYSNNVTQVPFGILGIWNDDEFKCEYKRLGL